MEKKKDTKNYTRIFSILIILAALFSDIFRNRGFSPGPLQLLVAGIACGVLVSTFFTSATRKSRIILIGVGIISTGVSILANFSGFNSTTFPAIAFLFLGLFTGLGFSFLITILLEDQRGHPEILKQIILFLAIITPFLYWIFRFYIRLDLWYDEVYTLDWFVFTPLIKTLTNYSSTNNHIFFNILNNIYLRIVGIQDIYELMDKVHVLRYLTLLYSIITLIILYITVRKHYRNISSAAAAVIILATTIPFYNFAVQIRGYGLSSMFISMLVYFCWSYEENPKPRFLIGAGLSTFFSLVTIPTNLYTIMPIGLFYGLFFLIRLFRNKFDSKSAWSLVIKKALQSDEASDCRKSLMLILIIAAGSLLSVFIYLPVSSQFLSQAPEAGGSPIFLFKTFSRTFPIVMEFFLSGRWLFLLLILFAFLTIPINWKKIEERPNIYRLIFFLFMMITPFLINQLYGQIPYTRVFVMLSPIFALLITAAYHQLISLINIPLFSWLSLLLLGTYCYFSFSCALDNRNEQIYQDISQGKVSQNIYYNYYQAYYHPHDIILEYTGSIQTEDIPTFVYHWGDTQSTLYYLKKEFVTYHIIEKAEDLSFGENGKVHVITAFPMTSMEEIMQVFPDSNCQIVNKKLDFLNILFCESSKQ